MLNNNNESTAIEAELVLDCLDFEILVISKDFKIIFANKYYLDANHLTPDDVVGKYCYKLTHHIDHKCVPPDDPCPIDRVVQTGQPEIELHIHTDKNGGKKKVYVTSAPTEDQGLGYVHLTLPQKDNIDAKKNIDEAIKKTVDILNIINLYQRQMKDLKTKTAVLLETKQKLESKISELEKFNKLVVGRELKMIELKNKIKILEKQRALCQTG